jgi:hypothetical protein
MPNPETEISRSIPQRFSGPGWSRLGRVSLAALVLSLGLSQPSWSQADPVEEPPPEELDPWAVPVGEMPPEEEPQEGWPEETIAAIPLWDETVAAAVNPCGACANSPILPDVQPPRVCSNWTTQVRPLRRLSSGSKFLATVEQFPAAPGAPRLQSLVGVSADASCHLRYTGAGSNEDKCHYNDPTDSQWKNLIDNLKCHKLNKMQLWVALNGLVEPNGDRAYNSPFVYVPANGGTPGYWRLDQRNDAYFNRLREVVDRARARGVFVEVVFFAPWEGDGTSAFQGANGKMCVSTGRKIWDQQTADAGCTSIDNQLLDSGFPTRSQFVVLAANSTETGFDTQTKRARMAQRNVIQWTIDALWCFENVQYQIANEPEALPGSITATIAQVTTWQAQMIAKYQEAENAYVRAGKLDQRHLIAVQTFTSEGANYALGVTPPPTATATKIAEVDLVNSHYTTVNLKNGIAADDLGAVALSRTKPRNRPIGFNETKLSGGPLGMTFVSSSDPCGGPASARSEAWEFMLNLGAAYEHWGYKFKSTNGQAVRGQLCALKSFLGMLPLQSLKSENRPNASAKPSWVVVQNYPGAPVPGQFYQHWTALEPVPGPTDPSTAPRHYLLYLHRDSGACISTPTCPCEPYSDPNPVGGETSSLPPFRGFHPATMAPTNFELRLPVGSYQFEWVKPENISTLGGVVTLQMTGPTTCTVAGGAPRTPCTVATPTGNRYDLLLWVRRTGN